jgi:aspartokinase
LIKLEDLLQNNEILQDKNQQLNQMLQSYNNNFSIIIQEQKETNIVLKTNQVNESQIQQLLKDNQ